MAKQKNEVSVADDKKAEIWFEKNWKKICTVTVIMIVVGMGGFFFINRYQQQQIDAAAKLAVASPEEIMDILEKDPAVPGAGIARMRLVKSLLDNKKYDDAKVQLLLVSADEYSSNIVRFRARLDAAACDELSGRYNDAAEAYLAISTDYAVTLEFRNEAAYHAGRILLQLKDKRGVETLTNLSKVPADPVSGNKFWQANASALLNK